MNTLAASTVPGGGSAPFNFPSFSGFEEMLSEISSYSEAKSETPPAVSSNERPTKKVSHKRKHNQRLQAAPEAPSSETSNASFESDFIPGISGDTPSSSSLLFDGL